jgi:hypothetical protein
MSHLSQFRRLKVSRAISALHLSVRVAAKFAFVPSLYPARLTSGHLGVTRAYAWASDRAEGRFASQHCCSACWLSLTMSKTTTPRNLTHCKKRRAHRTSRFSIHRVARPEEIATAIDSARASGAAALNIIFSSPLFYLNRRLIIERTVAAHLPTIWEFAEVAEESGFAAYGPRVSALLVIMAQQIIKLFRGTKIAEIPVEQPTKFDLVIQSQDR